MKGVICWVVIVAAAASASVIERSSAPSRIVGGQVTDIERYPSIVQVEFLGLFTQTWSQSCAANVISISWQISAAHCFTANLSSRRSRCGATFRNTGGVLHPYSRLVMHENYNTPIARDYDVCLMQTAQPMVWTPVLQPVTIPSATSRLPYGSSVIHAGWGATSQGGPASSQLRDVQLYKIDNAECARRYLQQSANMIVTPRMICAGVLDVGGRDACQGDSGGPLYYRVGNDTILVGLVSWGQGCAQAFFPGVSGRMADFTDWAVRIIQGGQS